MANPTREEWTNEYVVRDIKPAFWLQAEQIESGIWERKGPPPPSFRADHDTYRTLMRYAIILERHFYDYMGLHWDPRKFSMGGDNGVDYTDNWGVKYDVKARDCRRFDYWKAKLYYDWPLYWQHGFRSDVYILSGFTADQSFLAGWISWFDLVQYGNAVPIKAGNGEMVKRIMVPPQLVSPMRTLRARIWLANGHFPDREWVREEDAPFLGSSVTQHNEAIAREREDLIPDFLR